MGSLDAVARGGTPRPRIAGESGIGGRHLHAVALGHRVDRLLQLHDGAGTLQSASINPDDARLRGSRGRRKQRAAILGRTARPGPAVHDALRGQLIGLVAAREVAHILEAPAHEDALCEVAAQAHGAEEHHRTVGRNLAKTLPQVVKRNVDRSAERAKGILLGGAHVDERHLRAVERIYLAPPHDGHRPANDVTGRVAGDGDGVFSRRERRRIGVLETDEIVHRAPLLDDECRLVDALVHALVAHALGSVELARDGVEGEFGGQHERAGIVAGM